MDGFFIRESYHIPMPVLAANARHRGLYGVATFCFNGAVETITMYTAAWCGDCRAAKRYLAEKGIAYNEVDIDEHPDAVKIIVAARGKRVLPTLEYKGKFIDGNHFNVEKFAQDLAGLLA